MVTNKSGAVGALQNSNLFFLGGVGGGTFAVGQLHNLPLPLCHAMPCLSYVEEDIYLTVIVETGMGSHPHPKFSSQ